MIGGLQLALVIVVPMQATAGEAALSTRAYEPASSASTHFSMRLARHHRRNETFIAHRSSASRKDAKLTESTQGTLGELSVNLCVFARHQWRHSRVRELRAEPVAIVKRAGISVRQNEWFGTDKLRHFLVSMALTQFTYGALRTASTNDDVALPIAIGVAAVGGVGKEVHDVRNNGSFSLKDLVWDGAGIAIAGILLGSVR